MCSKTERVDFMKIKDTVSIVEISHSTGLVNEYDKDIYEENSIQSDINYIKSKDELFATISDEFGNYFLYFYDKMNEINIPTNMKARFLYLCTYIGYNEYLIDKYNSDKRLLVPLNRKDLENLLGLSEREFKNTIKILTESGLLIFDGKYYKVNTTIITRGKTNHKKGYTRVFFNSVRYLYTNCKPIQHKQLYYLFMILPYVNVQHNVVCSNIDEEMQEKIEALNVKDMCDICSYNRHDSTKFKNNLLKFKIDGKDVVIISYRGGGEFIRINPSVYYAGTRIGDLNDLMGEFGYRLKQ